MKRQLGGFNRGEGRGIIIPPEEQARMQREMKDTYEKRERLQKETNRRQRMLVTVNAGTCQCNGDIHYTSTFRFIQTGEMVFGGPARGHWNEIITCSCSQCALLYDSTHTRFAPAKEKVKNQRLPPADDWETVKET